MTKASEEPKRRGRPRLADDDRKRHTMTFRMRTELRAVVEEIARSYGRSLSEQIEQYVEAGAELEVSRIYQYNADDMSNDMRAFMQRTNPIKEISGFRLSFVDPKHYNIAHVNEPNIDDREGSGPLSSFEQTSVSQSHTLGSLAWAQEPGGREGAISMVRAMLSATRKGAIEALISAVGSEAVEAAIAEEAQSREPAPLQRQRAAVLPEMLTHAAGLDETRASLNARAGLPDQDLSIGALMALIGRLTARSPDLSSLSSGSWPRKFVSLPPDTRAALAGTFGEEAAWIYENLMRRASPRPPGEPVIRPDLADIGRGNRLAALRRMQDALLPQGDGKEYFSDLEDEGIDAVAPAKKGCA